MHAMTSIAISFAAPRLRTAGRPVCGRRSCQSEVMDCPWIGVGHKEQFSQQSLDHQLCHPLDSAAHLCCSPFHDAPTPPTSSPERSAPLPAMMRPKMTQNAPHFVESPYRRRAVDPFAAPKYPSRQYSQLQNATVCNTFFGKPPSQTASGPTPAAVAAPSSLPLRPTTPAAWTSQARARPTLCKWPHSCINITLPSNT